MPFAVAAGALGAFQPTAVPLCFYPEEQQRVVCPFNSVKDTMDRGPSASVDIDPYITAATTRGDILLVEGIGVVAAAVGVALTIRKLRGTSTPFNVPPALAVIKLPLGALTAVMGLLLMAAGFVPGLSALDTSAQILGWAAVFGYAQHLLTRVLDQRANSLLEVVGGRGAAGDREAAPKPVD